MIDWYVVVLTPLLVLPILLLFGFVGCFIKPNRPATPYEDQVLKESSLLAYWRLGEQGGAEQAADEKGLSPGIYGQPPATAPHGTSQGASGQVLQGQSGLLTTESYQTSVDFEGGYVVVPFKAALNPPSFTVEAWVLPGDWQPGFDRAVVTSAEIDGTALRGFSIFSRWNPAAQTSFWSASIGTITDFVEITGPEVTMPPTNTFIALTYDGLSATATLYVAARTGGGSWNVQTQNVPSYAPAQVNALYIGANHLVLPVPPLPPPASPVDFPFIGRIQEVALYSAVVSEDTMRERVTPELS